ncbi:hypothetical protein E4T39_06567 [Aureobasidium subglaciale]|nr:hypothetical protein E4T39_06567 [Aureobasidium subglaciale]
MDKRMLLAKESVKSVFREGPEAWHRILLRWVAASQTTQQTHRSHFIDTYRSSPSFTPARLSCLFCVYNITQPRLSPLHAVLLTLSANPDRQILHCDVSVVMFWKSVHGSISKHQAVMPGLCQPISFFLNQPQRYGMLLYASAALPSCCLSAVTAAWVW